MGRGHALLHLIRPRLRRGGGLQCPPVGGRRRARSRAARTGHSHAARADPTLRMRWPDGFSGGAHAGGIARDGGAARCDLAHLSSVARAGGGTRRGHRTVGRRAAAPPGRDGLAREIQQDPLGGSTVVHGGGPVRRAQPGDQRGGGTLRPVLRARSQQPDRLHDRRQRRRELGRRALSEVRPDAPQRAAGTRLSPPTERRSNSAPRRSTRRGSICSPSSSAAKACLP